MGIMAAAGVGMTKSKKKAVQYFQRAVELGHTPAMYALAVCFMDGDGIVKSPEEAFKLFKYVPTLHSTHSAHSMLFVQHNRDLSNTHMHIDT